MTERRYIEVNAEDTRHPEWMSIRDTKTGRVWTVLGQGRSECVLLLRALNFLEEEPADD